MWQQTPTAKVSILYTNYGLLGKEFTYCIIGVKCSRAKYWNSATADASSGDKWNCRYPCRSYSEIPGYKSACFDIPWKFRMKYVEIVGVIDGMVILPETGAVGPGIRVELVNKLVVNDETFTETAGAVGPGRRVEFVNRPVVTDVTLMGVAGAVGPSDNVAFVITLGAIKVELTEIGTPVGPSDGNAVGPLVMPVELRFANGPVGNPDGPAVGFVGKPVGVKLGETVVLVGNAVVLTNVPEAESPLETGRVALLGVERPVTLEMVRLEAAVEIGSPIDPDEVILGKMIGDPDGIGEIVGVDGIIPPISGALLGL